MSLDREANALCATGKNQSPIDMVAGSFTSIPAAQLSLSIPDMEEGTEFENLGTTVEVVAGQGNMTFGGVSYTLAQFHFHLPSEHLDDGTSMAMEMHMVWEGAGGEVAVIGTFIDIDDGGAATANGTAAAAAEARSISFERHQKQARREAAAQEAGKKSKKALPGIGGSFFHVNAPTTSATTASTLLETVLGSVEEIAEPGSVTETKPLIMSELVSTLTSGSFQT